MTKGMLFSFLIRKSEQLLKKIFRILAGYFWEFPLIVGCMVNCYENCVDKTHALLYYALSTTTHHCQIFAYSGSILLLLCSYRGRLNNKKEYFGTEG